MKSLKIFFLSLLIFLVVSCKKKSDSIFAFVDIMVLTDDGKNALSAPAIYDANNISVYHVINGQSQLKTDPQFNGGKPYMLLKDNNMPDKIRVFLYYDKNESTSLTLIKFGNTKMDTLKAKFKFTESSISCEQVWFNGIPKSFEFNIVK